MKVKRRKSDSVSRRARASAAAYAEQASTFGRFVAELQVKQKSTLARLVAELQKEKSLIREINQARRSPFEILTRQKDLHYESADARINEAADKVPLETIRIEEVLIDLTLAFLGQSGSSLPVCINLDKLQSDTPLDSIKLEALHETLSLCISILEHLAQQGNAEAISLLAEKALRLSEQLFKLQNDHLEEVRCVARTSLRWPVLKSHCVFYDQTQAQIDQNHERILDHVELGKNHPIKGQKFDPNDGLGRLVLRLFEDVRSMRHSRVPFAVMAISGLEDWQKAAHKLPPFSVEPAVVNAWWKAMKLRLDRLYPTAKVLVKMHRNLVTAPSKLKHGPGTIASDLRSNLFKRFRSMVGLSKSY